MSCRGKTAFKPTYNQEVNRMVSKGRKVIWHVKKKLFARFFCPQRKLGLGLCLEIKRIFFPKEKHAETLNWAFWQIIRPTRGGRPAPAAAVTKTPLALHTAAPKFEIPPPTPPPSILASPLQRIPLPLPVGDSTP